MAAATKKPQSYAVFTIVDGPSHSRWVRVGSGVSADDGSIDVVLDALPVNGRLHLRIRDEVPR